MAKYNQYGLPVAYYRGGTSKALFFHEDVLPEPGPQRDEVLKRAMGSPDPLQVDGMGGTKAVTSKIAIIKQSVRNDADIDYTFAQVGITDGTISYKGNCGNISAAVGPFAIDEGLVKFRPGSSIDPKLKTQEVRIYNTGTKAVFFSHVPIDENGCSLSIGNETIAGVPGTGAPILMDYKHTIGGTLSKGMLPTGKPVDVLKIGGKEIQVTICDVANWCVFVNASDFDITGHESAAELTANTKWIEGCQELRGKVGQLLGLTKDWKTWDTVTPFAPLPIFVAPSKTGQIIGRLYLDKMCHESMAGTGAICTTACSRIPGTIVHQIVGEAAKGDAFEISHPLGIMTTRVQTEEKPSTNGLPQFRILSFVRTARRIMDGTVYVPKELIASERVNGNTGQTTCKGAVSSDPPKPATKTIADFVFSTKYADLNDEVKVTLKNLLLDYIGVAASAVDKSESTEPVYSAIIGLQGTSSAGSHSVFRKGNTFAPQYAALMNGFLAHALDFDDTFAEGVLHPGVTAITAGLVAGESSSIIGEALIEALAVGYEVTCRIGKALGQGAYSRGFHNTATAGIFGAVATIAKIKGLSSSLIQTALGLAGSKPAGSMQYLENGSWNKRLHPGFAVHDAWLSVTLAESGVVGADKILEGRFGFFHAYTPDPVNYEELLQGLGKEWVFLKTSWKPFPACRMTHGLIAAVDEIRNEASARGREVNCIKVKLPSYQYPIVGEPTLNKVHPANVVDGQFSAYYQISLTWLHGGYTGLAGYKHLGDSDIHKLSDRITIVGDDTLGSFNQEITIEFVDGITVTKHVKASDEQGAGESSRENIAAKFFGLAIPVYGEGTTKRIQEIVYAIESHQVSELMELIR